jgi:hypothetical protein
MMSQIQRCRHIRYSFQFDTEQQSKPPTHRIDLIHFVYIAQCHQSSRVHALGCNHERRDVAKWDRLCNNLRELFHCMVPAGSPVSRQKQTFLPIFQIHKSMKHGHGNFGAMDYYMATTASSVRVDTVMLLFICGRPTRSSSKVDADSQKHAGVTATRPSFNNRCSSSGLANYTATSTPSLYLRWAWSNTLTGGCYLSLYTLRVNLDE